MPKTELLAAQYQAYLHATGRKTLTAAYAGGGWLAIGDKTWPCPVHKIRATEAQAALAAYYAGLQAIGAKAAL